MGKKLSTKRLAKSMLRKEKMRRVELEAFLNDCVEQPNCGCTVVWSWIWPNHDWILPRYVRVERCHQCGLHAYSKQAIDHANSLLESYEETLNGILLRFRQESQNELTDYWMES